MLFRSFSFLKPSTFAEKNVYIPHTDLPKNDPDEYCPAHFLQLEVHSCSFLQKLIDQGNVSINGISVKKSGIKLKENDEVSVTLNTGKLIGTK